MKILIALSHDLIFKPSFLFSLMLRLQNYKVVQILEVRNFSKKDRGISSIKFWGIKGSIILGLLVIFRKIYSLFPFPDFVRSMSNIKKISLLFDVPYKNIRDINSNENIEFIKNTKPDVVISFHHQILKSELLNIPNVTFVNCHPSMLPKYRGVKPIFWSMLNNDVEFGVTVHKMELEIDCGEILSQIVIKRNRNWSLLQNYIAAYEISVDAITNALKKLQDKKKNSDLVNYSSKYYKMPTKGDLKIFKKNNKII